MSCSGRGIRHVADLTGVTTESEPPGTARAVLFDLYNTLVRGGSVVERDAVSAAMATDLGVDPTAFADLMRATFDERCRGSLGDLANTVRTLAARLGAKPGDLAISSAVRRRLILTQALLDPAISTLDVLDEMLADGWLLGLVSDASAETPQLWPTSPLSERIAVAVFSCQIGVRKPDPAIYRAATGGLGVAAQACVYVGDGGSGELAGATALGMTAVMLRPQTDGEASAASDDCEPWGGPRIASLSELPAFLRGLASISAQ